jgi:hypothetical protein
MKENPQINSHFAALQAKLLLFADVTLMNPDMFFYLNYTVDLQRRNHRSNCCLVCFPLLICLLLGGVQMIVAIAYFSSAAHRPRIDCGYCTASTNSSSTSTVGGIVCSTECPLPIAPKWPPVLQLPPAPDDMDDFGSSASTNLTAGASITRAKAKPPAATFLVTGTNRSFAESMHAHLEFLQ